jgi:hypothetical protein
MFKVISLPIDASMNNTFYTRRLLFCNPASQTTKLLLNVLPSGSCHAAGGVAGEEREKTRERKKESTFPTHAL